MKNQNLYTIKKGDTFWALEREWNMPHGTLKDMNVGVDPRKLQIGQKVKIKMPPIIYLVAEPISTDLTGGTCDAYPYTPAPTPRSSMSVPAHVAPQNSLQSTVKGVTNLTEVMNLSDIITKRLLTSNELWHLQKNGSFTHVWRKTATGASHWKNNIVSSHRTIAQQASQKKGIVPKNIGGLLLVADIGLSGEVKPSHAVSAVMLGASSTGVGAVVAGIYFAADFGTYLATGKSIGDRIDEGWVERGGGQIILYEGLY